MRHVADQRVREIDRVVGTRATDMYVLTEHGELLREEAVFLRDRDKALGRIDLAVLPFLERMRPAAGDRDVHLSRMGRESIARGAKLGLQRFVTLVNTRVDFDHALRDLGLELAGVDVTGRAPQQIVGIGREIEVARVDELKLELHADGQRLRGLEVEHGSNRGRSVRLRRTRAMDNALRWGRSDGEWRCPMRRWPRALRRNPVRRRR